MNDERIPTWTGFFERAVQDLQLMEDRRMEYDGVWLQTPDRLDYGQWRELAETSPKTALITVMDSTAN